MYNKETAKQWREKNKEKVKEYAKRVREKKKVVKIQEKEQELNNNV